MRYALRWVQCVYEYDKILLCGCQKIGLAPFREIAAPHHVDVLQPRCNVSQRSRELNTKSATESGRTSNAAKEGFSSIYYEIMRRGDRERPDCMSLEIRRLDSFSWKPPRLF